MMHGLASLPASILSADAGESPVARALQDNAIALLLVQSVIVFAGLAIWVHLLLRFRAEPIDWSARVRAMTWRPWSGRDVLMVTGLVVALSPLRELVTPRLESIAAGWGWPADFTEVLVASLCFQIPALLMIGCLMRAYRVGWEASFGISRVAIGRAVTTGVTAILATVPPMFFYTVLYRLVFLSWSNNDIQDRVEEIAAASTLVTRSFYVLLAVVLAPIVEELFFRGILLSWLMKRVSPYLAVTLVSLLFALVHDHHPSMPTFFILSCGFCLAYLYSGSLLAPILMHALFNLSTVATIYFLL